MEATASPPFVLQVMLTDAKGCAVSAPATVSDAHNCMSHAQMCARMAFALGPLLCNLDITVLLVRHRPFRPIHLPELISHGPVDCLIEILLCTTCSM